MSYPAPVACTLCGHETIGTFPGGLCRRCAPRTTRTLETADPTPSTWRVEQVHAPCEACAAAADQAIAHARCTGSREASYSDNGNHAARVTRVAR